MKNLIIALMLVSTSAFANEYVHPTDAEIEQSRSCFAALETLGCDRQEDSAKEFRTCVAQAQQDLDSQCQELMLKLYGSN